MSSQFNSGQITVGTTATLVATVGSVPDNDGVLVSSSVAVFVGGPDVTAATGFPVPASTPVRIPTTGASGSTGLPLYAITSSGTAVVSFIFPS